MNPWVILDPRQTQYDAITVAYPDAVTEVYTCRIGGASGAAVMSLTLTFSDSTKATLLSVVRNPLVTR